ncbi:MAG: acyltransferase [Pseudomonadota bacterium]|nr:acyltransferase [Pseudomonadota bacterium]
MSAPEGTATGGGGDAEIVAHASLRGVAAYGVLLFHSWTAVFGREAAGGFLAHGWIFVDLFFMLSGFILFSRYAAWFRSGMRARAGRFLRLRFLRIYPNFLVWFLAALAFNLAWHAGGPDRPDAVAVGVSVVLHLVMAQSILPSPILWNTPLWSLSVEMALYFAFPAIAFLSARFGGRFWALALPCAALIPAALIATEGTADVWRGGGSVLRGLSGFVIGCALAQGQARIDAMPERLLSLAQAGALIAAAAAVHLGAEPIALASFAALVLLTGRNRGAATRWFGWGPLRWLGRISFSFYACHMLCMDVIENVWSAIDPGAGAPDAATFLTHAALSTAASLAVGAAGYALVERPAHRWARRRDRMDQSA